MHEKELFSLLFNEILVLHKFHSQAKMKSSDYLLSHLNQPALFSSFYLENAIFVPGGGMKTWVLH